MASNPGGTTFAALRLPVFRRLWIGGLFTFLGLQMLFLVRGFLAFELTGNNSSLGVMYLGFGITMVIATPFGGVAADRFGKRAVMIAGQVLITVTSVAIALAIITEVIEFWMLVVGAVSQGISFALVGPARVAFTAQLAGRDNLGNGMVLMQMSLNGTRVLGPSLAGVLIGVELFGAEGVYLATAALLVVSTAMTLTLPAGEPTEPVTDHPFEALADGLRYVRDHRPLRVIMLPAMLAVVVGFPYVAFLPSLVGEVYDVMAEADRARSIGWLSTTQAVGAVLATLFVARGADGPRVWLHQARWGLGFGAALVLLGLAPELWAGLIVIALAGAASTAFQALSNAVVLTMADEKYHGRVQSLMMVSFGGFGIAAAPLGVLADQIGLRATLGLMGALVTATMLVFLALWSRLVEPAPIRDPIPDPLGRPVTPL